MNSVLIFPLMLMLGVLAAVLAPQRVMPIPTFLPESMAVLACCLGAAISGLMKSSTSPLRWGWSVLCPLALATWIAVCIPFVQIQYADALIFPITSLLIASVAAGMGQSCTERGKLGALCLVMATAWVVASLGTLFLQVMQLYHPGRTEVWLLPRQPDMQPFGNLAQRNQAACVHALALFSLVFVWTRASAKTWRVMVGLGAVAILAGLVLTGSRSGSLLGALAAMFFSSHLAGNSGVKSIHRDVAHAAGALAVYGVAYAALQFMLFGLDVAQTISSAGTRWSTTGNVPRFVLQELALEIVLSHPITGAGWGAFTLESLARFKHSEIPLFANHSHNILTQLAAETGLIGLLIFAGPVSVVLRRAFPARRDQSVSYLLVCCIGLLAYSMVEFPLWHVYFLFPFAIMLGALDRTGVAIRLSASMRVLLLTLAIMVGASTVYFARQYITIAQLVWQVFRAGQAGPELRDYIGTQLKSPGFSPQTELLVFGVLPVDRDQLDQKIELGSRVVHQYIDSWLLTKFAGLLALKGDVTGSAGYAIAACRFYPEKCAVVESDLSKLAGLDPAAFGPVLREFKAMQASGRKDLQQ